MFAKLLEAEVTFRAMPFLLPGGKNQIIFHLIMEDAGICPGRGGGVRKEL
jgi:hypothetical protein